MEYQFPHLLLTLSADPPYIAKKRMPVEPPQIGAPRVDPMKFTLHIQNDSRSDYRAECHGSGLVVVIKQNDLVIGRGPFADHHSVGQVTIPAGESQDVSVEVNFPHPENVSVGMATAEAIYTPNNGQKALLELDVREVG